MILIGWLFLREDDGVVRDRKHQNDCQTTSGRGPISVRTGNRSMINQTDTNYTVGVVTT